VILARIVLVMPRLALAAALLLAAAPLFADCIGNGHYTIVAGAQPERGTRFPYTEDLVHHLDDRPVGARMLVSYSPDLHWVKIQSGCAEFAEQNVSASAPVNLLLRASLRISFTPRPAAPLDTRYEIQLRLGKTADDPAPLIVATELRHVGPRIPRAERFAGIARDLPAGNYVYSMWCRLLDGPETNEFAVDLQWLTAQGVPREYPAAESAGGALDVGTAWTRAGEAMMLDARWPVDVALQSSWRVDASDGASKLEIAFTSDDEAIGEHGIVALPELLPEGMVAFDDKRDLSAATHRIQLWMRSDAGVVHLGAVRASAFSMPLRLPYAGITPMQRGSASDAIVVKAEGDPVQPVVMSPICGNWSKVLDFEVPPSPSSAGYSWSMDGFVEIAGYDVSGYGQLGVEIQHRRRGAKPGSDDFDDATDIGMFEFQAHRGGDGFYFYGDCSKWANEAGTRVTLWVRRMQECANGPLGGELTIGRRWVTVKLLPSAGPHLP
jgi:hypothetical protein